MSLIIKNCVKFNEKLESCAYPRQISYILCDTIFNDYCSLAKTIHQANEEWQKICAHVHVFPLMVARSFFKQVVPDGTVDIGYSFSSLHWLSQIPAKAMSDQLGSDRLSRIKHRQAACEAQADEDFKIFLRFRAAEFAPGGSLLLSFIGDTESVAFWDTPVFKCLILALDEMALSGVISSNVADAFFPPSYMRTVEQVRLALSLDEVQSQWTIQTLLRVNIEHPSSISLQRDSMTPETTRRYAEEMIGSGYAVCTNFLASTLSLREDERNEVLLQWKRTAVDLFINLFGPTRVQLPWIHVWLQRK